MTPMPATPELGLLEDIRSMARDGGRWGTVSASACRGKTGRHAADVEIESIGAFEPGLGWGSSMLRAICEAADRRGASLFARACIDYAEHPIPGEADGGQARLEAWYERHGFSAVEWHGHCTDMVRLPMEKP